MYICLCNGHTSQELEALARSGIRCVERAYEILGGAPVCGHCIDFAGAILAGAEPEASARNPEGERAGAQEPAAASP